MKREVRTYATRGDVPAAKILAREVARSNKVVTRLYNSKAQLTNVEMELKEQMALVRVAGALQQSTRVLEAMGRLVKISEVAGTARELSKEMYKAGIMSEMLDETFEQLDEPGMEEAAEEEVNRVLVEIAGDVLQKVGGPSRQQLEAQQQEEREAEELRSKLQAIKS
jgi:charged multivesicular body protein 3